jgi:UDP-N-acetylglucosamine 4,6-dehydratase
MFKGKTLMITGGTGSFGEAVLKRFLDTDIGEIRVLSRDEKKQDDMRRRYATEKIKYYIGDVRNLQSLKDSMYGVDYIFHAAALKQVPSCEFFPMEAVMTNIVGTNNVLTAAIEEGVKKVICLSTDKAVYPVNAMGTSKAMMEKVVVAKARSVDPQKTTICCTRYGNVLCSRGSIVPLFVEQIQNGKDLTVTDRNMSRFIMTLEEAVDLVLFAFHNAKAGDIFVKKSPACNIMDLAQATKKVFNAENRIRIIGIRHGEKLYEVLLSKEERANAVDMGDFYRVPADQRTLNYDKYMVDGNEGIDSLEEFNSKNAPQLDFDQLLGKLKGLDEIKNQLQKNYELIPR